MLGPALGYLGIMGSYTDTDSLLPIGVDHGASAKHFCPSVAHPIHALSVSLIAFAVTCVSTWCDASQADSMAKSYPPCATEPSVSDVDAAKGAFQAGRISFEEGDYDRSILYWEDAFRRDCTAAKLLLNIGRAYELNGNLKSAVVALQTYLQREPDTDERTSVEKRIEKLQARVNAQESPDEEPQSQQPAPEPKQQTAQSKVETKSSVQRPIWPVITTSAGVVVMAVGTTFAVLGQKSVTAEKDRIMNETVQTDANGDPVLDENGDPYRCSRQSNHWHCPSDQLTAKVDVALDQSEELKRAKTERAVGIAVLSGGAAITAVGAYFWYTLWNQQLSTGEHRAGRNLALMQPALLPVIAPNYRGLSLLGRF